ncbi:MAG: nucleoside recognition domain-containing protein [Eubacteriales bacterium]|nr:spore maturation protein [Clostridiales bacterium]
MTSLALLCGAILPLILLAAAAASAVRGVDAVSVFTRGASNGIRTVAGLLPTLLGLLCAVYMLRACGLLDLISSGAEKLLSAFGLPGEIAPLILIRPFSGSGALAAAADIMETSGPDSLAGRIAAVMLGSSETTLYTANICFGAAGVRRTRYALPAAFVTELAAAAASCAAVLFFWG